MAQNTIPEYVLTVLKTLENAGYKAYCVGGCVRDRILGKPCDDWDITTSASPDDIMRVFDKTVPTGIKYGTVTVFIGENAAEVTTFRTDGTYTDDRHPESVSFTSKLEDDLARRDFTMNALAMDKNGEITDIFGGMDDIRSRIIRCVGKPEKRFSEDALRMIRAVRFSSTLGFTIEENTKKAMDDCALFCRSLSGERVLSEIQKILLSKNPEAVAWLFTSGALGFDTDRAALSKIVDLPENEDIRLFALSIVSGGEKLLERLRAKRELFKFASIYEKYPCSTDEQVRYALYKENAGTVMFLTAGRYLCGDISLDFLKKALEMTVKPLCFSGRDLKAMGYDGKELGDKLDELMKIVSESPEKNNRRVLMQYLRKNAVSNYDTTKYATAKLFLTYDQNEIIDKLRLAHDDKYLYISMFGVDYRVSRQTGLVEGSRDKFANCYEADYNEAMTIYDLLGYSKPGAKPSGVFVNMRSLSTIQGSGKNLGDEIFGSEGAKFDGREERLEKAFLSLGGVKENKGDVSSKLPGFLGLDFVLRFWSGDEEFKPTFQVFTDKNILDYMHFETVWYAVSCLLKRVSEEFDGTGNV